MTAKAREPGTGGLALRPSIFMDCFTFVLGLEGERVDHPDDRGGRTAFGIRQDTYDAWRRSLGRRVRDVFLVAPLEVVAIYRVWYWEKARGPELEGTCPCTAFVVFDAFVHHGSRAFGKVVQRHSSLTEDGVWGPQTWGALDMFVRTHGDVGAAQRLLHWRREFCKRIALADATQEQFLDGWLNRMDTIDAMVARHVPPAVA